MTYRLVSHTRGSNLSYDLAELESMDVAVRMAELIKDDSHRSRVEVRDASGDVVWSYDRDTGKR